MANARPTAVKPRRNVAHLRLVRPAPKVDEDTVECLELLLECARSGEINGIAFACSSGGMKYHTDARGFLFENPTFARGAISSLADEIACLVHERDDRGPR